jgi:ribonuclease Z
LGVLFYYLHTVRFAVTILGSGAAIPANGRNPSSQLVEIRNHLLLLDCGEGTQMALRKFVPGIQRISHIFISHLHGDHFYGLVGLISSFHLLGRINPLHIYGVPELKEIIDLQLKHSRTELVYPLEFHEIDPDKAEIIVENEHFFVKTIPLNHRIPTCGFIVSEKPLKRNIRKDFVNTADVPVNSFEKIRAGADFVDADGKVYPNSSITTDPPRTKSYAYCSDTTYHEPIVNIIRGVNLLYHEATFANDKQKDAKEKLHATAREAARIALQAGVGRLVIGHFSARYRDPEILLDEAREIFPDTIAAEDGLTIEL